MKRILIAILAGILTLSVSVVGFADEVAKDDLIAQGPGAIFDEKLNVAQDDISGVYLSIPLTEEDLNLLARMAYGETMYHDGTCPENTVKACYEVVFNRYLHDMNNNADGGLFHKGALTVSRILTKGQFEGIVSQSTFNKLPFELQMQYINLAWQVHNQGPTVLTTDYLYWQSSKGTRGKDNRIWVGFIYDENGNKIAGTTTDRSKIVKGHGNWYRITYK